MPADLPPPTGLGPDGTRLPSNTTSVALEWNPVPGATRYAVRADDLTDPGQRDPRNDCVQDLHYLCLNHVQQTSVELPVAHGHRYRWWVHAANDQGLGPATVAGFDVAAHVPPPTPTGLEPLGTLHTTQDTVRVELRWSPTPNATDYAVRASDPADPSRRDPRNNCVNDHHLLCVNGLHEPRIELDVPAGHTIRWWVHARNAAGWSAPAIAEFAVRREDDARFVSQLVLPYMITERSYRLRLRFENTGISTWKPDDGVRLGSQNPRDNQIWGVTRAELPGPVAPGEQVEIEVDVTCPEPGWHDCQWRLVREHVHWFGQPTDNLRVYVRPEQLQGTGLERVGPTIHYDGTPIALVGGQHPVFFARADRVIREVVQPGTNQRMPRDPYPGDPCPNDPLPEVEARRWSDAGEDWSSFFQRTTANGCNLVRVFLTNIAIVTGPEELEVIVPYQIDRFEGGLPVYRVREAVEENQWNMAYWHRLQAFAAAAHAHGVILQLSLFNYYDLSGDSWPTSFWNPDRCSDSAWGNANLVAGNGANARWKDFVGNRAELRAVQRAFAGCAAWFVRDYDNIVFEILNEPHVADIDKVIDFNSTVAGWFYEDSDFGWYYGDRPRPLLSVNPHEGGCIGDGTLGINDLDAWANRPDKPHYDKIAIASYHGLTQIGTSCHTTACGHINRTPRVDPDSIALRHATHFARHPNVAAMFSTDAVFAGRIRHDWPIRNSAEIAEMYRRDGQIRTSLSLLEPLGDDPCIAPPPEDGDCAWRSSSFPNNPPQPEGYRQQRVRSDLGHWTSWVMSLGTGSELGKVHFQNISAYEASFEVMGAALADLGLRREWTARDQPQRDEIEGRIVAFFNAADSAEAIVERVLDNPVFGTASERSYGIRRNVAERILERRALLPDGLFTSVGQIDAVLGVGEDTLQDLFWSFGDR